MATTSIKGKKTYGYRPDLPDQRDYQFAQLGKKIALPASVNLRLHCSAVKDQGQLGSCVSNALASALEYIENKDGIRPCTYMSRLFIYFNARPLENTVGSDSGCSIRDGIKTLTAPQNGNGCCPESEWPYIISKYTVKPTSKCYTDALKHTITSYYRLNTLNDMQTCLSLGFPFVFGITCYESFESQVVANTGVVPMPAPGEQVLGGHALLAVGYDNSTQRFLVENSWGVNFGMKGYITIPYAYLTNPNLASDLWCINKATGM